MPEMTAGEAAFATAVAAEFAKVNWADITAPPPGATPVPAVPVPVATSVLPGVAGEPTRAPLPPHAAALVSGGAGPLGYLPLTLAALWAWRTGRLPRWDAERLALWLPWNRGDAAAARRCRWQGRDWLVRGVLPDAFWQKPAAWPLAGAQKRAYLAILAGEEGTGKSYLLTYLAVCLVLGRDWLGFPVRRLGAVVYADSELDAATFWQRVDAVVRGLRLDDPEGALRECRRRIVYLNLADHGEDLAVPSPQEAKAGARAAGIERIKRTVRARGAGLVLLDGLTTGGGTAPGDQEGATRQQNALQRLGCAVLAIDHLNGRDEVAGSRSKRRLGRVVYKLLSVGDPKLGRRKLVLAKANFAPLGGGEVRYACTFHPGPDGELGPVTFTVEEAGEGPGEGVVRPRPSGPVGRTQHPAPSTQDSPLRGLGVGVGVGAARGAVDRETQPRGARGGGAPERQAYAPILAAVQRRGPGADVPLDDLAAETSYSRRTIGNRTRELRAAGRLGSRQGGTVCLPETEGAR